MATHIHIKCLTEYRQKVNRIKEKQMKRKKINYLDADDSNRR